MFDNSASESESLTLVQFQVQKEKIKEQDPVLSRIPRSPRGRRLIASGPVPPESPPPKAPFSLGTRRIINIIELLLLCILIVVTHVREFSDYRNDPADHPSFVIEVLRR